jgi:hypothetical protein
MRDFRFPLAALLLLGPFAALADESPVRTVENFYGWAIRPSAKDLGKGLDPVRPLLGQELVAALEAQRAYEAACARLVPAGVKPYMLDQSPFFLWPDKAKSLLSAKATVKGDTARVIAQLAYDDLRWTDTVILRRTENRWVILNIEWQEGSLTKRLVEFASHRCAP